MTSRQPFTPQHSPLHPSSNVSPTSSVSADEERTDSYQPQIDNQGADQQEQLHERRPNLSSKEFQLSNALKGWTAHQSHGQATVLFYVPRWIQQESLEVVIGNDYIIAGLRGQKPIINARLAGRININSSTWQLERKSNGKRYRSRSRSRTRTRSSDRISSSGAESSSGGRGWVKTERNDGKDKVLTTPSVQQGVRPSRDLMDTDRPTTTPVRSSNTSRPSSPVQSDASSFELLGRSTDTFASRPSLPGSEGIGSPSHLSSPHSLSQSMTLSDDGNNASIRNQDSNLVAGRLGGEGSIRSMESSMSVEKSQTTSSNGSRNLANRPHNFDDPTRDAKLVTLHLDKIDGGIWPCIVAGPVPSRASLSDPSFQPLARLISVQSQGSLNAAISEAIRQQQETNTHSRESSSDLSDDRDQIHLDHTDDPEMEGQSDSMINQSTLTVDTISSDDSTTVLGSGQTTSREEELYNMDPISLTLMGMQHARRSSTMPFAGASTRDESHAFECYRRAWREAEIPTAIEHLVHYYLPLNPAKNSTILASYRQRLTAALGGSTALARLYVSYAHLYMHSYEYDRPLLALPLSGLSNNPFGTHSMVQDTSSSHVDNEGMSFGPLHYLQEARKLDPSLDISQEDWQEAKKVDEELNLNSHHIWSGAASPSSRSEGIFESDTGSQPSVSKSQAGMKRKTKRRKAGSRRDKLGGHHHSASPGDQGIVFLVVSRAALLSVVVAGGMAVAGWWRRAATAGAGS